jgi:peptidoglycan/LPS O-acetylase OafA/YrhL
MIFENPIFTEMILPFLLVFVLFFAILQRTKILGEGKSQIDALVSLVIAIILITVPVARDIVVNLMPWLAVGVAVILVFLILYGFVSGADWMKQRWIKIVFGILAGLFVIGVVLYVTGLWSSLESELGGGDLWSNILIIAIIIGALVVVLSTTKRSSEEKSE